MRGPIRRAAPAAAALPAMDAGSDAFETHGDAGEWDAEGSQSYEGSDEDDLGPALDADEE